ncbi:hypothetical protein KR093_006456 [Drosophila rubida]|uniref:Peptidase M14 domain-containing protein n=1 Tax=Drosophila rubida TaxID=30044 RepID=A0AAD4KDD6_9MUSC|nr:hypothetical protein KR093_006456 [Drosophila rubida]
MYVYAYVVAVALTCLAAANPTTTPAAIAQVQVIEQIESFLDNPHYLSNEEIGELFARLNKDYPTLAQPYVVGTTIEGRPMHALALNAPTPEGSTGDLLRPMVKLVANVQGDETLGRQIVLYMAEYLANSYEIDNEVQRLLNTTEIHFLPSANPDGFALAKVSHPSQTSFCYR